MESNQGPGRSSSMKHEKNKASPLIKVRKQYDRFFVEDNDTQNSIAYYGNNFPYPFPLNKYFQIHLKTVTKAEFKRNYAAYNAVVRNFYEVIFQKLDEKPDKFLRQNYQRFGEGIPYFAGQKQQQSCCSLPFNLKKS